MSDNPLLDRFLQENTAPTVADLRAFVSEALGDPGNFELFDPSTNEIITSNRTIVYSGLIDGVFAGNVAVDAARKAAIEGNSDALGQPFERYATREDGRMVFISADVGADFSARVTPVMHPARS